MSSTVDVSMTVRKVAEDLQKLKKAYDDQNNDACQDLLAGLKLKLIHLPTYLYPSAESKTRSEELSLTREVLETAVLVSARRKDMVDFEQYFSQLQIYYDDVAATDLPESPHYLMLLGLNLIRLLVSSRIAQFHSELEKIPSSVYTGDPCIRYAVQVERYLMEGSYSKLLNSRKRAPCTEYLPVVELLESTVRQEVAMCVPHAYTVLSVAAAQKVLMVSSQEEALEIGRTFAWKLSEDGTQFVFTREEEAVKREIPCAMLIKQDIEFAADLQNII